MSKMKDIMEFFVEIETEEGDEVPEEAASDDPDVAAKAAKERAEEGPVGKKPENPKKLGEMAGDPYAGTVDQAALSGATEALQSDDLGELFDKIYDAAGLPPTDADKFTIHKVDRLLESDHLSGMSDQVKKRSIMVTLESSNQSVEDIVQDAVARDKAIDQYDQMLRKEVKDLEETVKEENAKIEKEIEEFLERKKQEIAENKERVNQARRMYERWSGEKEKEEERLFEAVSVFVDDENPVSKGMGDYEENPDPSQMPNLGLVGDGGGDGGEGGGEPAGGESGGSSEDGPSPEELDEQLQKDVETPEPSGDGDDELADKIESLEDGKS